MCRRALAGLAVTAVLLAGCGGHYDGGALRLPDNLGATKAGGATVTLDTAPGPATQVIAIQGTQAPLSWLLELPQLRSGPAAAAINRGVRQVGQAELARWKRSGPDGAAASLSCQTDTLLDSAQLLSISMTCTAGKATVAVSDAVWQQSTGARVSLADLLRGRYLQALSSEAVTQLTVAGTAARAAGRAAPPTASAFSDWGIEPGSIDVVLDPPAGPRTVSYSLDALAPYVRSPGFLRRR